MGEIQGRIGMDYITDMIIKGNKVNLRNMECREQCIQRGKKKRKYKTKPVSFYCKKKFWFTDGFAITR